MQIIGGGVSPFEKNTSKGAGGKSKKGIKQKIASGEG